MSAQTENFRNKLGEMLQIIYDLGHHPAWRELDLPTRARVEACTEEIGEEIGMAIAYVRRFEDTREDTNDGR